MKKILSLLLTLCLLLGVLPSQALAYVGDIISPGSTNVQTSTNNNSLVLQNDYIRVTLNRQTGILTTAPTAASDSPGQQKPYCEFITYDNGIGYNKKEITHPATLSLKSASFVEKTPNGDTKAIKAEYALTFELSGKSVSATTAVYYELVQCGENKSSADAWGVLTSVDNIKINANSFGDLNLATDMSAWWGYTLDGFSGMGHANATDGPAIKMSRTVVKNEAEEEISTESSVITSKVDDLDTWQSFSQGTDWCYNYITEVYVDGYAWANPFVGLSGYYKNKTIKAYLPDTVSVTPGNNPSSTRVECRNDIGYYFSGDKIYPNSGRFLWGFRNLTKNAADVPSEPDKVEVSINAKRLAAFADGNDGVTVEYVADDAALNALKQRYGNPVALISGDYESKNGTDFAFTGGAALLSPSVTATWGNGGELVIHKDGTITHSGLSLNAPSFKFYQPNSGAGEELKIKLTQDGFLFEIDPEKNDAVIYVDIPYATAKLEKVTADAAGNLVFAGGISFQTVFEGASFTLKELGYGLNDKNEFTVNGVHATGSFDTAKTLSLELAKVEGEVNTFKGKEKYAFTLELNAFDLFETEAELELVRSKKDGSLLPNTLYFFVSASPGIPLIPPVPIGQLNGRGGAGFSNLADTVNGDYFAIPPLKLRGTLKGTYLHLIEGKGDVVIGPSEISLKASDVGIVGTNASIIDSFGYSLQLNGQERTYHGTTYKGIYFVGSETLELDLPSTEIDVFILDTSIELGAFGGTGTKNDTKHLYLGVGANAVVKSKVQVPSDVPVIGGWKLGSWDVDLIVGGQTEFPIEDVSVDEGMKNAFKNIDVYLGAMTGVYAGVIDARLWVLVPNIVETNFRRGGGWDVETKWFGRLPEWDWSEKGVEPVVQSMPSEDSGEDVPMLLAAEPVALAASGENSTTITVNAGTDETPYILLAFGKNISEDEIKQALSVTKSGETTPIQINWLGNSYEINSSYAINADTDIIHNKKDNKDYRVAILRLKEGGTYQVNPGSLTLDTQKSQGVSIAPFEELALSLNSNQVSGGIKYAEENTKYVLRTYFANEKGGADYLIDEQEVTDASKISVTIPQSGALAPSGEYYVTSFLMTEKSVESIDENGEKETLTGLVAIDHQQFNTQVSYQNQNQPTAPQTVTLELAGNEVMTAKWDKVDDAAGYAVTIYQKNGGKWIDTGFGYDLDKETTSINMALTVGGEETTKSKNLSANEAYKVGVRAYKEDAENEGGKYYSAETESADEGVYLPEYTPLKLTLSVNGTTCTADENGVYHAYIGGESNTLAVSCADNSNATFKVTRMDKTTENEIRASQDGSYTIPDFEGSLMFKIDGISSVTGSSTAKDVTSVFLLVNVDKTAPVLTLSDPIFYADMTTGAYKITGTADAGSEILYGNDGKSVYASSDGTFTIPGTLEHENSGVLSLYAQDAAGSKSDLQFALITKQEQYAVTVNGSYAQDSGAGSYAEGAMVTIRAGTRSGYQFSGWTSNSGVTFADASSATTTFTMPASAVTVTANWSSSGGSSSGDYDEPSWPVTAPDTENGSITVRPKNASKGDTVTITTKPDAGYELESMTVTDRNGKALKLTDKGNGKYTFTMPASKVEINATFVKEVETSPFSDVSTSAYYYEAVKWAQKKGITGGIGNGLFGPNQPCTRAQIVTFLWRAAGSPMVNYAMNMSDVPEGSYYAEAVRWALSEGITTGTTENTFSPDSECTRAQAVAFLFRYAASEAVTLQELVSGFSDADSVPGYALPAMNWALAEEIVQGNGSKLMPNDSCTRAQIVTFLFRAYQGK